MSLPEEPRRPSERTGSTRSAATPVSPFDDQAEAYDAWFEHEGRSVHDIELEPLRQVLPALHGPWLEVGVGSGQFARPLGIPTGIDPSLRMAELAVRRGIAVLLARGENMPFAERSFGTVFLITSLCFVDWPLSVLREVQRVLLPGGRLVLADILGGSPWSDLYEELARQGDPVYSHATFRSYGQLIGLIERAGFSIESVRSTLLQGPGEVTRVESPENGFSLGAGFVVIVAGKHGERT